MEETKRVGEVVIHRPTKRQRKAKLRHGNKWDFGRSNVKAGGLWAKHHSELMSDHDVYNALVSKTSCANGRPKYTFEGCIGNTIEFMIGYGAFCASIHNWSCREVRKRDKKGPETAIHITTTQWPGEKVWNQWAWAPLQHVPQSLGTTVKVVESTVAFGDGTILDAFLEFGIRTKRLVVEHRVVPFRDPETLRRAKRRACPRREDITKECTGGKACIDYVFDVQRLALAPGCIKEAVLRFPFVRDVVKESMIRKG